MCDKMCVELKKVAVIYNYLMNKKYAVAAPIIPPPTMTTSSINPHFWGIYHTTYFLLEFF